MWVHMEQRASPGKSLRFGGAAEQIVKSKEALDKLRQDECWTRDLASSCLDSGAELEPGI